MNDNPRLPDPLSSPCVLGYCRFPAGVKDWQGVLGARAMAQGCRPAAAVIVADMDEQGRYWLVLER